VVGDLGAVTATSVGASSPQTHSGLWPAAGPRLGVELTVSPTVALRAWGEALWTVPNNLVFDNRTIDRFPSLSGGATVAAVWRFF
jgi:hypothetical protein